MNEMTLILVSTAITYTGVFPISCWS